MCGIVGYLGVRPVTEVLLNGLQRLEYRGYDSAGLVVSGPAGLKAHRVEGRIDRLRSLAESAPIEGRTGIGHTRWATHGAPSLTNAHPHFDASGRFALVHNGIIENHAAIRSFLNQKGIEFQSETDTEALVQLIGFLYQGTGDLLESVRQALRTVRGTFGIALLSSEAPELLIAARRGSPLIVGVGSDELMVASDASALIGQTSQVLYLDDDEIVTLGPDGLHVSDLDAVAVERDLVTLDLTLEEIELKGHDHHMHKEMHEQPASLQMTLRGRVNSADRKFVLGGLTSLERQLPNVERALLFGCGSAWHAALIGEYMLEELASLPTTVEYASELRYRNPLIESGTLAVGVSQSGETADTLAALREVQTRGATTIGVVNAVGSSMARETDAGVYLHVGPEIGVASTKAFLGQVVVLAMLAGYMGRRRHLSDERLIEFLEGLEELPDKVREALETEQQMKELAFSLADREHWLYLGRGVNFPAALEGALKLKEVSYIHAEGLPAAEMKHGPIAMIDKGMPVVVLAPRDGVYSKVLSNIEEVRSRGAHVIAVTSSEDAELDQLAHDVVRVPETHALLSPVVTSVPLQLLAYHAALAKGRDVDKPRNLAKSVTVE
ncbi:glutamine--fructose-6-phosphate transaminase (isomerizing) [Maioricimonas sp. JC845]|uniref:glutamine--fructose-6-phosphate transaminase (isomerizing) n=1 Tax=Maioricimonas sp. JC845 TaxID=3232138 RepID=UPI00345A9948